MKKEYKIELVQESAASILFFGSAKVPVKKTEKLLNEYGSDGWSLVFMVREHRRMLLFWSREALIITLSRDLDD